MAFDDTYEVVLADTEQSLREHFRLRYRVYCLNTGFEDPRQYPNGQEQDAYDPDSVHFLVRRKRDRQWVAALRLVLPDARALPIQDHGVLDRKTERLITQGTIAEVSRVCHYRGTSSKHLVPDIGIQSGSPSNDPSVMFGLLRAAFFYCLDRDIEHLLFLIRPAMARLIGRMCIPLRRAGQGCDHRGTRYPYAVDLRAALTTVVQNAPGLAAQMCPQLAYRSHSDVSRHQEVPMRLAS